MPNAINPALEAEYLELLAEHSTYRNYGSYSDLSDAVVKAIGFCNGLEGRERAFLEMIKPAIECYLTVEHEKAQLEQAKKWAKYRAAVLLATGTANHA